MSIIIVILIMIFSSFIGAIGSMLLKKGAESFVIKLNIKGIINILKNWKIIVGLALYILATVFFIYLLKTQKLSLLYPMTSLTYIFATILAITVLKERMNIYKIIGILAIVIGVVCVSLL